MDAAERLGIDLAHKVAADDMGFDVVVDGCVLPAQPLVMFSHHQQADVPVMVGGRARELSNLIGPDEVTLETFRDWVKNSNKPLADDVLRVYAVPTLGMRAPPLSVRGPIST